MRLKRNAEKTKVLIFVCIVLVLLINCGDQAGKKSDPEATGERSQTDFGGNQPQRLPMLIDLGKGTCIPCKKMKPILDELAVEYQGKAIVKIIDLRYEPQAARQYGIRLIPTQIFFDAEGNEVYRHEGFMDKQSIKMKFAEMGVY